MREKHYSNNSKDSLKASFNGKIRTTMIGALSSIEKHLGFLWGEFDEETDLTDEQRRFEEIYEALRKEILDKGNHQSRLMDQELENYDVRAVKYQFILRKDENDGRN